MMNKWIDLCIPSPWEKNRRINYCEAERNVPVTIVLHHFPPNKEVMALGSYQWLQICNIHETVHKPSEVKVWRDWAHCFWRLSSVLRAWIATATRNEYSHVWNKGRIEILLLRVQHTKLHLLFNVLLTILLRYKYILISHKYKDMEMISKYFSYKEKSSLPAKRIFLGFKNNLLLIICILRALGTHN